MGLPQSGSDLGFPCYKVVVTYSPGITRDTTFKKMDKVNWDAVLRTNLDSLFNMTKQVADGMVERGWGRIINISSVNGSTTSRRF